MIVEPSKKIEAGNAKGRIIKIDEMVRGGFKYTDILFQIEGDGVEARIKCSVPSRIDKNSMLGRIIQETGQALIVGDDIDLNEVLMGKTFTFDITEKKGTGKYEGRTFKEIMPDTIKGA